jgi:hypothetical protein
MFEFPFAFWVVVGVLLGGCILASARLRDGSGLPMLALLGTIAFWYVGDAWYNDYANNHARIFEPATLSKAWWQVVWFLAVYLVATPAIHSRMNARHLHYHSGVLRLFRFGPGQPGFQKQLTFLFKICAYIWLVVVVLAVLRLGREIVFFFFPFWGFKAEPWGRGTFGSGYDSLLTIAFYFQMLVTAVFGVVAALSTDRRIRAMAFACCLLSWPYFVFDRTRNSILAVAIPGLLSWGFLRLRIGLVKRVVVLFVLFSVVDVWMKFVIENRGEMTITSAFKEKGLHLGGQGQVRHEGLNMFEELCWINTFMENGSYAPNWGGRYFADLVNPVPRVIWPGKPAIGFDYAVLRGQVFGGEDGVITATISTGLIGQGVVNFGRVLGPAAAALIMSFWAAILARLDLTVDRFGRLPLLAIGLFVTYNVGRDFCFLALYPFAFGAALIWFVDRFCKSSEAPIAQPRTTGGGQPPFMCAPRGQGNRAVSTGLDRSRARRFGFIASTRRKPSWLRKSSTRH